MFDYNFMIYAFTAGILSAIALSTLGTFLVARRYSLIADSLAHVSLVGVGAGLLLSTSPVLLAIPVAIIGSLLIEYLRQNKKISGETSLAIIMSGGLAIAVVLASLAKSSRVDFNTYLFGSIATTTPSDIITITISTILVITVIAINYQAYLYISFDENSAKIAKYKVTLLNYLLAALTGLTVVLSLRIIGGLLISALLVIPVVAASRFATSFIQTIIYSVIASIISVIVGLTLAFYVGIASGGAIVLSALFILVISLYLSKK